MSRAPVLLLGASSQIGVFAAPRLVAEGRELLAVNRGGRPGWFPRLPGVDWISMAGPALSGASAILSAGPLGLAVDALQYGVRPQRVVAFSTTSVFSKFDSRDRRERQTIRHIREMESDLATRCGEIGAELTILRPTLVYGAGLDQSLTPVARWIERCGVVPVAGAAPGLRQPVHAEDLAAAAVAALDPQAPAIGDTPLCGGETLAFREMVGRLFTALEKPQRIVGLPEGAFTLAVRAARVFPGLRGIGPEMVRRQALDLVFDDAPARAAFGYHPRPFRPARADFRLPETGRLERLARGEVS